MNGPVLVNSETPTVSESVVINTSSAPDFSDVKETSTDVKVEPSTNENLVSLLTDLRADFLSVVKLVEALNKNVSSNGDKVKQLEQTLNKLVDKSSVSSVSSAESAESVQSVPSVQYVQPVPPVQPAKPAVAKPVAAKPATARPASAKPAPSVQVEQKTKHAQQKTDKKKRSVFSQF
jgi:hypothetical protein